jgi:hypothetical protein
MPQVPETLLAKSNSRHKELATLDMRASVDRAKNYTPKAMLSSNQEDFNPQIDYKKSVLNIRDDNLPFTIKLCDAETHQCIFCLFRIMVNHESNNKVAGNLCICKVDKESTQVILFMLDFYKRLEIFVDW